MNSLLSDVVFVKKSFQDWETSFPLSATEFAKADRLILLIAGTDIFDEVILFLKDLHNMTSLVLSVLECAIKSQCVEELHRELVELRMKNTFFNLSLKEWQYESAKSMRALLLREFQDIKLLCPNAYVVIP